MMKKSLSFIFLFTLFTLAIVGCSKPKSPSGNGDDGGGDVVLDDCPTTPPLYSGALGKDLKGKKDICVDVKDSAFVTIEGRKDGTNIWGYIFVMFQEPKEYFDGVHPTGEETNIAYFEASIDGDNNPYSNKPACTVFYYKDSGERMRPPICNYTLDNTDNIDTTYIYPPFNKEIVAYAFVGKTFEESTEYFVLPPIHKRQEK